MTNWFTSDWHLRHHRVTVTLRGFATREEHDYQEWARLWGPEGKFTT